MVSKTHERHHSQRVKRELWQTFDAAGGYGTLEMFDEARLAPGCVVARHTHRDAEIITYVREGALANQDSLGRSGIIHAGEFQRMTAGHGTHHNETNASQIHRVQVFQISIRPSQHGLDPSQEKRRFSAAQRRSILCVIASPDGRQGSLRIHQDAMVYSAILERGQHIVHELLPGRSAWLHIVQGEVMLGDLALTTGDGAGVTGERAVSLTAAEHTELLLIDVERTSN